MASWALERMALEARGFDSLPDDLPPRRLPAYVVRCRNPRVAGAGALAMETGMDPARLRLDVTSPNGTTQAAIESFQAGGFEVLVDNALRAAQVRGQELSAANY